MTTLERSTLRVATGRIVRLVTPPILLMPIDWWRRTQRVQAIEENPDHGLPFDGKGQLWVALIFHSKRYAEWGAGESTAFALRETTCRVRAVDTSSEWLERTLEPWESNPRIQQQHVDLGRLLNWGRPASYRFRDRIDEYLSGPFDGGFNPDLVLVDGRFRVACFLFALLRAEPGSFIVFDDYRNREHYHIVEEVLQPIAISGRQAVFVRPEDIDEAFVRRLIADFKHVMD